MRKVLFIILTISIIFNLTACASNSNNYIDNTPSISSNTDDVSSEIVSEENKKPTGIEGLVDEDGTPAGNVYDGIDGQGFTTEFFDNYTCRATVIKTGELKAFDDWKFIGDGKIRTIYRKDTSIYSDYFIYENYLIKLGADSTWGTLEGDLQNGFTNNKNNDGDRILRKDGTYEYITKYWQYKGTYKAINERIIFIDAKDEWGDAFPIYLFIDNDNSMHYAYPKVN